MRHHHFLLLATLAGLALLTSCNQEENKEILSRLDTLENVTIVSIQGQMTAINGTLGTLQGTQAQLSGYVTSLQTAVGELQGDYAGLQSMVNSLKDKDDTFAEELVELKDYVDQCDGDVKAWVEQAYTSLEKFNGLQSTVSGISTSITTIIGRLNALDTSTQKIANDLQTATETLTNSLGQCQEEIEGIKTDLRNLQDAMDSLREQMAAIVSAVQSVVVVPDYSDGSVKMTDGESNELRFEVYPLEAASNLAALGVSALSLDCVETETKSDLFTNIPLTAVSFDGEVLRVVADGSSLPAAVKVGDTAVNARLRISDGTVTRSSEYFAVRILLLGQEVTPQEYHYVAGEAVDLGLSVKWSRTNLGASQPEENGAYFGWGETEPKDDYSSSTYKWTRWGSSTAITKYCLDSSYGTVDNKIRLDSGPDGDDAAFAKLGDGWRMPSIAEWIELRDNCTWEEAVINGVTGMKVSGTKAGYEDNWIFFPIAGYRYKRGLYYADLQGFYWSSSPYKYAASAYCMRFYEGGVSTDTSDRCYGKTIRPVYDTEPESTVLEVVVGADDEYYKVTGVVTRITGDHFGNMYINDGTVDDPGLLIYGSRDRLDQRISSVTPYNCFNDNNANSWTIGLGDVVTVRGPRRTYRGEAELDDVTIINIQQSLLVADQTHFEVDCNASSVQVNFTMKDGSLDFSTKDNWLHVKSCTNHGKSISAVITVDKNINAVRREGKVTFSSSAGDRTATIVISIVQESAPIYYSDEVVDLGLSVKWRSWNVGASALNDYGDYFAWGETEPKDEYSSATYKWIRNGKLTRYCPYDQTTYWDGDGVPDDKTEFGDYDYVDDVARAVLGGSWRMPTLAEFQELRDNCETEWTTINGMYGRKFISRKTDYTDKWIFFPAAGDWWDDEFWDEGYMGNYWSSSLDTGNPFQAWRFRVTDERYDLPSTSRRIGASVRPVCE